MTLARREAKCDTQRGSIAEKNGHEKNCMAFWLEIHALLSKFVIPNGCS
jgi:hypothetical protein